MMVAMMMRARLNLNGMKQRMTDGRTYPHFGCNFQDAYKACIIWIMKFMKAHTARSTDMPMYTLVGGSRRSSSRQRKQICVEGLGRGRVGDGTPPQVAVNTGSFTCWNIMCPAMGGIIPVLILGQPHSRVNITTQEIPDPIQTILFAKYIVSFTHAWRD